MHCPFCFSENLCKLSLVYESGSAFSDSQTTMTGLGIGNGGFGGGVGVGRTKGVQRSVTALRAAPPPKRRFGVTLLAGFVCLALVHAYPILWLGIVIAGVAAFFPLYFNLVEWPELYSIWDASYLCERCGTIAIPAMDEPTPVSISSTPSPYALSSSQPRRQIPSRY